MTERRPTLKLIAPGSVPPAGGPDPEPDVEAAAAWHAAVTARLPYPSDVDDMRRFAAWLTRKWLEPLGPTWDEVLPPDSQLYGTYLHGPEYTSTQSTGGSHTVRPCVVDYWDRPIVGVIYTERLDGRYVNRWHRYPVLWQCLEAPDARLCFPGLLDVAVQIDRVCLVANLG